MSARAVAISLLLACLVAGPAGAVGEERAPERDLGRTVYDAVILRPLGFVQRERSGRVGDQSR